MDWLYFYLTVGLLFGFPVSLVYMSMKFNRRRDLQKDLYTECDKELQLDQNSSVIFAKTVIFFAALIIGVIWPWLVYKLSVRAIHVIRGGTWWEEIKYEKD
jgi:hypothetical protein